MNPIPEPYINPKPRTRKLHFVVPNAKPKEKRVEEVARHSGVWKKMGLGFRV